MSGISPTPGGGSVLHPVGGGPSSPGGSQGVLLARATAQRVFAATRYVERMRRRESRRRRRIVAPAYISGNQDAPFLVNVIHDGGYEGDATTKCTLTYQVRTLDGELIQSNVPVLYGRTSVGRYVPAPVNSYAFATRRPDGSLHLLFVPGEQPDVSFCECTP